MSDIILSRKDLDKDWQRYRNSGKDGFDKEYIQQYEQKQQIIVLMPSATNKDAKIQVHKAGGDKTLIIYDFIESPKTRNFLYNIADLLYHRTSNGCENHHIENIYRNHSPERIKENARSWKNFLEKIVEFEKTNPHQTQINQFAKEELSKLIDNRHIGLRTNYFRY